MKWLIKIERDENGDITNRSPMYRTDGQARPRGGEFEFVDGDDSPRFPVVTDIGGGVFEVLEDLSKLQLEEDIELRIKRQSFGQRIIAIMGVRNEAKSLTDQQVIDMRTTYSVIREALQDGDILAAEALITAVTPDGTVTTNEDKTTLLAEIAENKLQLEYV